MVAHVNPGTTAPRVVPAEDAVIRHVRRPEWGDAVLAWAREDKRAYQFEDGELRIFHQRFYHLLQATGRSADGEGAKERRLRQEARIAEDSRLARREARRKGIRVVSLDEQIQRLKLEYPGGFQDQRWREDIRGQGAKRRLKRHRDAAVQEAQRLLGADVLGSLLEGRQHDEIWKRAVQVMKGTDLIAPSQVRPVANLPEDARREYAEALVDLLHGSDSREHRLDRYLQAVRAESVSWQLATVLPALVHPDREVCIRPASFRRQAKYSLPGLKYEARPRGLQYEALRKLARLLEKRLTAAGEAPRDLLDVYDFVWATLRSASLDDLSD